MGNSNIEKVLLQIKTDLKDLKNLRAELKTVKQEANETGKSVGDSFKSAFGSLAAGFTVLKIKSLMDNAVGEFNKLEKTMRGLQATARLTGNSFEALKKQVTALSTDGVLSIDQASTAMKTLLAQGIQADKAFSLLDAAKKVGAFNNIVGDTGQAVADFVKFLQTGSAELAENLDPSIIKVVKSLGGYEKIASDAGAKQKLINAVIEKGGKLTQDYEKFLNSGAQAQVTFNQSGLALSQTLGQKLQPAYNALLKIGTAIVNGITSVLSVLDSTTVSIIAFAAIGTAGLASLGAAAVSFGIVSKAAFTAALGPVGLLIAAITTILALRAQFNRDPSADRANANAQERRQTIESLIKKERELAAVNSKTYSQEKELIATKEELRKKARELGLDYDKLIEKAGGYAGALKEISKAAKQRAYDEENAPVLAKIDSLKRRIASRVNERTSRIERYGASSVSENDENAQITRRLIQMLAEQEAKLVTPTEEAAAGSPRSPAVSSGTGKATPEFRFIKLRDDLKELNKEYDRYLARLASEKGFFTKDKKGNITNLKEAVKRAEDTAEGQEAARKLKIEEESRISSARQRYAEFIEDRFDAEREKILQAKNIAIEAAEEEYNARVRFAKDDKGEIQKAAKELADKKAKIDKKAEEKNVANTLQSFNDTLRAANDIASGALSIRQAQGFGGKTRAVGSTISSTGAALTKAGAGKVGVIVQGAGDFINQAGQLYDSIKGIFGKSDEDRAREAEERKRQQEEANRLLEIQADYQKRMLAIQEANAKLPFENLQRNLRLIDIGIQQRKLAGESETVLESDRLSQRQAAISGVLSSQSGAISGGSLFKDVVADAPGLTKFLSERGAQAPSVESFVVYANAALGNVGSIQELQQYYGYMQSLAGNVPPELAKAGLEAVQRKIANFWEKFAFIDSQSVRDRTSFENRQNFMRDALLSANYGVGGVAIDKDNEGFYDIGRVGDSGLGQINRLFSEINSDTTVADQFLSVIEQDLQNQQAIKENTKKTAENTTKLTLLDDRRKSVLDLGNRRIFSQGLNIDFQNVKLPQSIASKILATSPGPVLASDTVSELKKLVTIAEEQAEWLAIIAANTDGRTNTSSIDIDNYLIRKLAEIRSRRIS